MDPVAVFLAICLVAVLWRIFFGDETRRLINQIPGPKGYPFIGDTMLALTPREEITNKISQLHREYGPIFRLWMGPIAMINISHPKYMEAILSSNKHNRKGQLYKFLYPWLGTGLLTSDGRKWFSHRKMITPTFHFKILDSFIEVFNENSQIMIQQLESRAKTGEEVDVYPYITLCALDIICETAMGTKVNAQKSSQSPYVNSVYSIAHITFMRGIKVWLHPDFIFRRTNTGKTYYRDLEVVQGFTKKVIQDRKQERKNRNNRNEEENEFGVKRRQAFLDLLLDASEDPLSPKLTDEELREEVDTFMFEGHDTTTAGICWAIFLLGHHPKIQEEVYQELKLIFEDDPTREATMQDLGEMKVLERVIKEALRLFPSVPFIQRTLDEDIELGPYRVPKDTMITLFIYEMHRNPAFFPKPETFNPDRFLLDETKNRNPYSYVPFSAGPRNCIGQKFALLEEKVLLSKLIRSYKFESLEKPEDVTVLCELVIKPKSGIKVRISKRT